MTSNPSRRKPSANRAIPAAKRASSTRPAVAFVEQPRWIGAAWPELWASALAEGREVPGLCYDPCDGETWAERFELIAPQSDRTWPVYPLRYTAEGEEREEERSFSFAHLAALVPAFRRHLWIVPPEAWADDQVPIAAGEVTSRSIFALGNSPSWSS